MYWVEQLEGLLEHGRVLPLTSNVVVDREKARTFLDELRSAIPEEVNAAKRINAEGERIIERAQEEADRIVARAQEQAAYLIEERELTRAAREEGNRIVGRANRESEEIRRGADEYAVSVLVNLEREIVRTLQSIKRGIALLDERGLGAEGQLDESPDAAVSEEAGPRPVRV